MSASRAFASRASAASVVGLAACLAAVSFVAKGGSDLGRATGAEVALVLAGGAIVAGAALLDRPGRLYGGGAVVALAALTALSAVSILWSVAPGLSFVDAGRMLAYLAVFAGAVAAARLAPRGACVVGKAVLLGSAAVVAYGLASRIWPASLAPDELSNRIGQPFGYWNALATVAAMMVPAGLWLGSRRTGRPPVNALAYAALGAAVLTILLTKSRGAAAGAIVASALWFAIVPLRLRSLPVLLIGLAGAAPVAAWALSKDAFSKTLQPLAARESVAGEFGLLVAVMVGVLLLAGLAVEVGATRVAPPMRVRRWAGIAAVAAVCVLPLALFTSVAFSHRGLGGTISDRVDELTSQTSSQPGEGAGRLASTSNSRGRTWREAGKVWARHRLAGTGDNTFGVARLRFRRTQQVSQHAHGFVPQTLADLGVVGLVASLALLAAWLAAALRTTGLWPRTRRAAPPVRRDWDADRIALTALALVAIAFGVQSLIDWTWFVHGPAATALVAGGFVAGRGPAAALAPAREPRARPSAARIVAAAGVGVTALLAAWAIWQPERSQRLSDEALRLGDARDIAGARAKASAAFDADPLSPAPLFAAASIESSGGSPIAARDALERAVQRFPGDPDTWLRLATFQLEELDDPAAAQATLGGALYLDPQSPAAAQLFVAARTREREQLARRARARGRGRAAPGG